MSDFKQELQNADPGMVADRDPPDNLEEARVVYADLMRQFGPLLNRVKHPRELGRQVAPYGQLPMPEATSQLNTAQLLFNKLWAKYGSEILPPLNSNGQ